MKDFKTDILIVGGGLTGLLTAYALSSLKLKVLLIDSNKAFSKQNNLTDFRTTAIAEGSKVFFEKIGIWKQINKHAEKINSIRVFDRTPERKINFFNPNDFGNLGYVVKNSLLKEVLFNLLKKDKNITLENQTKLRNIKKNKNNIIAYTNKFNIISKILIGADGKNSSVRHIMQTPYFEKKYNHSAVVVNFSHSKNHNNIAHEIFLKSGPLALLPMKSKSKTNYSSSLIWSNPSNFASNLISTKKDIRKKIIEEKIFNYTGKIINIFDCKAFVLSAHLNSKFYEPRLVYVGDSAHSIHPIAGQGWNLGVRDVKNLLSSFHNSKKIGLEIGCEFMCKNYHNLSYHDAHSLYQVTDKLNSVFLNDKKIFNLIRKFGFLIIEKQINIKNKITKYAMGI